MRERAVSFDGGPFSNRAPQQQSEDVQEQPHANSGSNGHGRRGTRGTGLGLHPNYSNASQDNWLDRFRARHQQTHAVIEEGTEGSESSKKSMTEPLLGEIHRRGEISDLEGGNENTNALTDGVHVHATKVVRRKCRLRCCPNSLDSSSSKDQGKENVYTPLTDLPSSVPSHGPHFRHEINDMMRIVDEGKGVRKIARYREQRMVRHGWMKAKIWHATYLSSSFCWIQILFFWLCAGVVAAFTYCLLYSVNTKTIESLQSGLTIASNIQTLVAFTLGFYLQKTIDIWWNLRHDTLQQLMNIVDNMCLRMAIYFPGHTKEDEQARETIMRYGLLSLALLFKDAREVDVWSEEEAKAAGALDMNDLMEEGLLTQHEAKLLEGIPAKSQMCWVWISSLFTKWCLDGRLPDPLGNQNTMLVYSEEARNAISTILAQLNMQFPLSYAHLIIFFSKLYMVMLAVEAGKSLIQWSQQEMLLLPPVQCAEMIYLGMND